MKKPDKCIHFNGMMNKTCDAGVTYDSVVDKSTTPFSYPCMEKWNKAGCTCAKLELPTPEQVAADKAESDRRFEGTMKARKAIVDYIGGPWKRGDRSASGIIDYPVCEGKQTLQFSRSGYNGHVHASCTTPDCVSWME